MILQTSFTKYLAHVFNHNKEKKWADEWAKKVSEDHKVSVSVKQERIVTQSGDSELKLILTLRQTGLKTDSITVMVFDVST